MIPYGPTMKERNDSIWSYCEGKKCFHMAQILVKECWLGDPAIVERNVYGKIVLTIWLCYDGKNADHMAIL